MSFICKNSTSYWSFSSNELNTSSDNMHLLMQMKQAEIFFGWDWSLFCKFLWIYRPTIVHEHNFWQKWTAFINIKETISQLVLFYIYRLTILIFWISGSSETLYNSVHSKIFSLPPNYTLYPAHDYTGNVLYFCCQQ